MISLNRLFAIARKEAIQLRRDVRSMMLAFALPLLMLLFFGYAISWDVRNIKLALVDEDASQHSRQVVEALQGSGLFNVT
jgi:ABC-2 type transport system permease protein